LTNYIFYDTINNEDRVESVLIEQLYLGVFFYKKRESYAEERE
tara:strand:+ start:787 stop:915 length:129 start_codon:yes stop_codon:yes gene_type:complete